MDRMDLPSTAPTAEQRLFPTLTTEQLARIEPHGRRRKIAEGEILVEIGDRTVPFFVVIDGEIQVLRRSGDTEAVIVTHRRGQFSGEGTMITGRRALSRIRAGA